MTLDLSVNQVAGIFIGGIALNVGLQLIGLFQRDARRQERDSQVATWHQENKQQLADMKAAWERSFDKITADKSEAHREIWSELKDHEVRIRTLEKAEE